MSCRRRPIVQRQRGGHTPGTGRRSRCLRRRNEYVHDGPTTHLVPPTMMMAAAACAWQEACAPLAGRPPDRLRSAVRVRRGWWV